MLAGKLALLLLCGVAVLAQPRTTSARAGALRILQGNVSIDGKPVETVGGFFPQVQMSNGQRIHVDWGRAGLQLNPGAALTMTEGTTVRMEETRLSDARVAIEEGSALVTLEEVYKGDRLHVIFPGGAAELRANGWYRFDAKPQRLRVYRGSAEVAFGDSVVKVRKGQAVDLSGVLALSVFNLKDPDPLIAWELQRNEESVKYVLPPVPSPAQRAP